MLGARVLSRVLKVLYPDKCGLCAQAGTDPICPSCSAEMEPAPRHLLTAPAPLSAMAYPYLYEGRAAQAVRRLKYARVTSLAGPMAKEMADLAHFVGFSKLDIVIPVPIHWTRRCFRGFNQAELLARALPNHAPGLVRIRATRPQVGLDSEQRRKNLAGAFRASSLAAGKTVLLVDDVTTTGGTAIACAQALKAAGAKDIFLLTYCGGDDPKTGSKTDWF